MTTIDTTLPTLAELRARKAASGGLPTLAELRARKAAGTLAPAGPDTTAPPAGPTLDDRLNALAQRAAVRGPVQRQFYGAEDVPADQRAEVQKFRAGIDPLNVEPGILNQPQEIIPTTPTGGNQQAIIAQMEQERFREGTPMSAPERFAQGLVNAPLQTARSAVGLVTDPLASAVAPRQVLDAKDRSDAAYEAQYGPRGFAGRLGAGVGQVAVAAPLAAAGGLGAGAGVLAASSAEQGYQDYLQNVGRDRASIAKALSVGGLYGAAEYVAERIGLGAILRETGTRGGLEAVKGALRAAGVNASEEALTQVAQNAISKYSYDPGRSLTEGAGEAGLIGGVAGGVAHGAMHAGGEHQATWADMEQLKATTPAPIGRGTTAQVPDGAGPPAGVKESFDANTRPPPEERPVQNGERQPGAAGDRRGGVDEPANAGPLDARVPPVVGDQGAPAGAESRNVDGAPAVDLYPRARQILDEIGVPDSGEVADRLGITLPEADRLVGRWEAEGRTPAPATGDTPEGTAAQDAGSSDVAGRSPESSRDVPSQKERPSPNSTRPALGSSRLGIPLDVVSEATRQREAAAENIARQSRPFAPPGRAAETERRSVLNRVRNPDTAGYSTEGSLTAEGVFPREDTRAPRRENAPPAVNMRPREDATKHVASADATPKVADATPDVAAREPWQMTRDELERAVSPKDRAELQAARPLLRELFPADDARISANEKADPWGIHRAVTRGDELPRVPTVDLSSRHRKSIERAIAGGRPVPPAVLADYPDLATSASSSRSSGEGTREGKQPWEMTQREYIHTQSTPQERASSTRANNRLQPLVDAEQNARDEFSHIDQRYQTTIGEPGPEISKARREAVSRLEEASSRLRRARAASGSPRGLHTLHELAVRDAVTEGRPVPAEVLKDYPELGGKAQEKGRTPKNEGKPAPTALSSALAETLTSLRDKGNGRGYVPDHLTPERLASARAEGLIDGPAKKPRLTNDGDRLLSEYMHAKRDREEVQAQAFDKRQEELMNDIEAGRPISRVDADKYFSEGSGWLDKAKIVDAPKPSRLSKVADFAAKAAPSRPAFKGTIQFGEPRHGSTSGITGASKVVTAFHLDEAGEHTVDRIEIVKPKYGNDWVLYRRGKDEMVSFGSQKIARPKYEEIGKADNLREAKQAAEAVLRGEIDDSKPHHDRLRPLAEFEPSPSRAWSGTHALEGESPYMTDGRAMFKRDAVAPSVVPKLKNSDLATKMRPDMMEEVWADSVKAARENGVDAKVLGVVRDIGADVAYLDLGGNKVMAADANRLKFLMNATKADRLVATSQKRPIVMFKGKDPVAVLMPRNMPEEFNLARARGEAALSKLSRVADYAAKRAAALKAAPDIRQAGKGFKGKGGRAGAGNLQAAIGWAAWKAVERGAQGLEKVRITVEHAVEAFKRFGIEHTPDKAREFVRAVNRMLAASENKDGTASAHKLEALLADARQSASADVREGMAKRGEQTTARRKLTEQGQKHLDEMRAKREDFADQLDALKAKHDLGQDVRRELVSAAKRYLDPADQGKILPFIASARAKDPTAKNPDMARDWYTGLRKILDIADESAAKKARAKLLATAGGPERAPRTQTLRNIIDRNLGVLPQKTELSRGVIEPDKLLPHNRDAVAPLVGDLRKTFVLGKNIDTFADHLEERAGALGSGWLDDAKLAQLKAIGTKSLADLTTDQATLLTDALHHLEHLNKVERTAFIGGKETDRAAMHDTINAQLEDRYRIDRKDDKKVRAVTRAARNVKTFLGEQHRGFGHLIGTAFGEDGPAYKALYEGPHRGESEGMGLAEESKDALRKTLIKHDVTESTVARMRQDKHTVKLPGGGTIELTSAERIDVAGLWSDPKNKKLIEKNGLKFEEHDGVKGHELRLAPADLDAITESMTPVERDTLAEFKKQTNGPLAKAVNEASVRSDGFEIATNPDHYSRKVDSYGMDRNRKGGGTIIRRWLEDMGILKPRTEHSRALLIRDFFSFADAHIDKMARYAKMAEPIRDALIALGDPTIRSTLIRKFGRDFVTRLEDHYEYVSGTGKHATPADEKLIRKITGLGAVYTLWGRLTSAALQNVGFLSASVDSKTAGEAWRISRHLADLRPTSDDAAYHDLIKHSGALRVRHEHGPTRLVDFTKGETRSGIGSQLTTNVVEVGLKPLSVRDKFVSVNLFKEIRETVKGEHPDWTKDQIDEEAAMRTERRVGRTQNPSQRMDRSQMEREADTNARKAAALLFSSAGVRVGNMIQARIYEAVKNPTRANKARAAWALAAAVIGASAAEGVRELWRKAKAGFQEEPRGRDMTQHGVNVAADLANNFVPGSGDVIKLSAAKIRHRPANFDTGSLSGQIVGGASVAYDLATILFSGDENAADKAWERLKKAGGGFAPLDIAKGIHRLVTDSD